MAILADAANGCVSRDKLTALLWPDADPDRAKRALAQALYALRRVAQEDELFIGVGDLRLNRSLVAVDCAEFSDALRAGDHGRAIDFYRGPFCDGLSVPGAPEFERWLEQQRSRYASQAASALRTLIDQARQRADVDAEIGWCDRLAAIDPLDSRSVVALMDAFVKAGDNAAAVRAGASHESLLRQDLDIAVSEEISMRMRRLRTSRPQPAPRSSKPVTVPAPAETPAFDSSAGWQAPSLIRARPMVGKLALTLALAAAVFVVALFLTRKEPKTAVAAIPPMRPDVVAVLPFDVDAADKNLSFLGEGAADLLSRWLSSSDKLRAVDPGTVLAILDDARDRRASSASNAIERARTVARRAGAGEVIIGRVSGSPRSLGISASIYDVSTGEERASAQVSGNAENLAEMMETVATRLVAQTAVGPDRADSFSDARFAVLRSYLRGESSFHEDDFKRAISHYENALALDSLFAPAALGLAIAADRRNAAEQHDRGLMLAWRARARLGDRDRLYLEALAGPRYPEPSTIGESIAAWERAVELNPDRASAWTDLGERFLYDGGFLGIRNANQRAIAAFDKSLGLDPANSRAVRGLLQAVARTDDIDGIRKLLSRYTLSEVGGELSDYMRWRLAVAVNDTTQLRLIRHRFSGFNEASLRSIAMSSQHEMIAHRDGERALKLLSSSALLGPDKLDVLLAQHSYAMNTGEPIKALDLTEQIEDVQPGSRAHLRLRVLDALYADGDTIAANRAAVELERIRKEHPQRADAVALRLADLCVLAQWKAAPWRSRNASAYTDPPLPAMIDELQSGSLWPRTIPIATPSRACAQVINAMVAVQLRSGDARSKVRSMDALLLAGPALGDGTAWATLATARLYEALGDPHRALVVVRQRPFMKGWPRYLAASLRDEARYARKIGDSLGEKAALARIRVITNAD